VTDPAATPDLKSPWWLAFRVLDEPGIVFRQLAVKPRSLVPLLLFLVCSAILMFGIPAEPMQDATRTQMEAVQERAPDGVTDADIEQRVEFVGSVPGRALAYGGQLVFWLIGFTVATLVLMLVFGALGKEPVGFKAEFAIVTHAFVPQLLGFLVIVGLMRFAGITQPQLSLGFLVSEESGFLHSFANQFGVFGAWNVYLLALGNQIRTGMKGIGTSLAVVGGLWILVNLIFGGLGSLAGGFGG